MKAFRAVLAGLSISIVVGLAACSGGSDSPAGTATPPPDLTGEYYGAYYDPSNGSVNEISLSISGDQITAISGQTLPQPIVINHGSVKGVTYWGVNPEGDDGGLTVSSDGKYMAYVISDGSSDYSEVAILEKGASIYTSFSQDSFLGSWSGLQYQLDANLNIVRFGNGTTNTSADGSFSGHGIDGTYNSSSKVKLDSSYGILGFASAIMYNTSVTGLEMKTLLSPDGKAAATWACNSGSRAFANCGFSLLEKTNSLINVELFNQSATLDAPATHMAFALGEISNGAVDCSLVKPYNAASCSANYDAINQVVDISLPGDTLRLDLSTISINMPVTLVGQNVAGTARFVEPQLKVRTQRHPGGYDYTVVVLSNPDPSFRKAILTGATGGATQLWNNDFGNVYDSYYQDDINDGMSIGTASYVSINSSVNKNKFNSGLYKVVLSDNPNQPNRSITYYYNYNGATAANLLASEPYQRGSILINGVAMGAAQYTDPATITSAPGYVISWPDNSFDPASTYWQVRFRVVNNGPSAHLKNREYRSQRATANNGGLLLNAGYYSWTAPQAFTSLLQPGDVVKVQIRASNKENTKASQTQGVYVCPDAVAQTSPTPSCVLTPTQVPLPVGVGLGQG